MTDTVFSDKQVLYKYHGSRTHAERMRDNKCRCGSDDNGKVFRLADLVQRGLVMDPRDPSRPLTSVKAPRKYQEAEGLGWRYIFAVSTDYQMHICLDNERTESDAVKHETLFHNAHVFAAGEIGFENGSITSLNDMSGSYGTLNQLGRNPHFAFSVLRALRDVTLNSALLEELSTQSRKYCDGTDI